jgi:hypothetical protein
MDQVKTHPIQGLHSEDAEGSYYLLLAKVLLASKIHRNERRIMSNEQKRG